MGVHSQLLTGFRYLLIRGDGKLFLDVGLPLGLTAASVLIDVYFGHVPTMSERGLVQLVNELLQVLVGFYVASLAAVASFASASLEQKTNNLYLQGNLIRRRTFLCYLFGYLSVLSLALYVLGVTVILAEGPLHKIAQSYPSVRTAALAMYVFLAWNMVTVTLMGLHYLIDRSQRADVKVNPDPNSVQPSQTD